MAKTSECIGCSDEGNDYRTDIQSKINRNVGLGAQHNGNGTIQYITNVSVSLGKLWFRNTPKNALCGDTIDETQIPNKIKLLFDSELTTILENININSTDGDGPEQNLTKLFEQIKDTDNLGEILPILEIDANNLKEEILKTPISTKITGKESTHNIVTLKPEVWAEQDTANLSKPLFVHKVPGKKFKQTCTGKGIGPAQKNIGTPKKPKFVEIPYVKGQFGIQLGSGRIYTYNGTSSTDAKTQVKPPESEIDCLIVPNNENLSKTTIPWILSIVPRNTNTTIAEVRKATVEQILNCQGNEEDKKSFAEWKKGRDRLIRFYKKNIVGLCRLLKYSESLGPEGIIDCKVEFYKDDVLLQPSNRSDIKVSLFVGFLDEQDPEALDFNAALSIDITIDDNNINAPADPRPDFVRLKCPAFKNLGELSKIEDYITADIVRRNKGEEKTEIYIIDNTIYSQDYPYCDKETKDIPKAQVLLALDRSDNKVNDIWKGFLAAVETGIMCNVSSDPLTKDFEDTLTNNIKLSNYKSAFGTAGQNMTFYSHKLYQIEERQPNNEIAIRNKNLPAADENAYIDCITGLFIDKVELNTSLFENTFFTDYKVKPDDNTHKFKSYKCPDNGKNLVAAQDLFLQARVSYPVYILSKLPNAETKYIKHNVSLDINLPFKSKLTGDSILYHEKNFPCDSRSVFIKATLQEQESIKTFFEHFGNSIKDANEFFFNIEFENGKIKYVTDSKYSELLPQILKINQDKLEQRFGKNFEYEPAPLGETGFFKIYNSEFTYDKEDNTALPCKTKLIAAIKNLEAKRDRAISRYHQPLFDWFSTIHVVDKNLTPIENFINESVVLTTTLANQTYYKKVLGKSPPYTFLQVLPTGNVIGGRNSLIKETYTTNNEATYNKNIETYHKNKPFLALKINAPKAPLINPSLEEMLSETSDDNLLLPGNYTIEINTLTEILENPEKHREQCGRGILGEGEK